MPIPPNGEPIPSAAQHSLQQRLKQPHTQSQQVQFMAKFVATEKSRKTIPATPRFQKGSLPLRRKDARGILERMLSRVRLV